MSEELYRWMESLGNCRPVKNRLNPFFESKVVRYV